MNFETNDLARASSATFVCRLVAAIDEVLVDRLQGAYFLGSLAHGGFSRRYSDIDFGLVVTDVLGERVLGDFRASQCC